MFAVACLVAWVVAVSGGQLHDFVAWGGVRRSAAHCARATRKVVCAGQPPGWL